MSLKSLLNQSKPFQTMSHLPNLPNLQTLPVELIRHLSKNLPLPSIGRLSQCNKQLSQSLHPLQPQLRAAAKFGERWRLRALTKLTVKWPTHSFPLTSESPEPALKYYIYKHQYKQNPDYSNPAWKKWVHTLTRDLYRLWTALHPGQHWFTAEPMTLFYLYLICMNQDVTSCYTYDPCHYPYTCFNRCLLDARYGFTGLNPGYDKLFVACNCIRDLDPAQLKHKLKLFRSKTQCLMR